jgi:putative ABC transport system permease protein
MLVSTSLMALRELRRNKLRSSLTTLGIVVGVASVITMVGLGRGASASIESDIASMGSNLLMVVPSTEQRGAVSAKARALSRRDAERLRREAAGVQYVAAASGGPISVVSGNKNRTSNVLGSDNEYLRVRGLTLQQGRRFNVLEEAGGAPACILGTSVRDALFGDKSPLGATLRVGSVACPVIGVLTSKGGSALGQDQDDLLLMPLTLFQRRIAGTDDVGTLYVSAKPGLEPAAVKLQIERVLRKERRIRAGHADNFTVHDMKELTQTLGGVTAALTALLGAIAGVSLIVGGIGIMNIMLVSVTERTREIGVRLALGALGGEVMQQFLLEAVLLSLLGGVLGAVLGSLASLLAAQVLVLPFAIYWDIILLSLGFSALVGVLFGFLPARKAASFSPVAALAHE